MIRVITPPVSEPVTLNDMKAHLRLFHNDEDTIIGSYITAARSYCEEVLSRAMITQTILYTMDRWPSRNRILLPRAPLISVTSVQYVDDDNNTETFANTNYVVDTDNEPGMIVLRSGETWPDETLFPENAVRITFQAGYGAAADVPATFKQAIMFLVAHYYKNREEVAARGHIPQIMPMAARHLLNMDRVSWTEDFNK